MEPAEYLRFCGKLVTAYRNRRLFTAPHDKKLQSLYWEWVHGWQPEHCTPRDAIRAARRNGDAPAYGAGHDERFNNAWEAWHKLLESYIYRGTVRQTQSPFFTIDHGDQNAASHQYDAYDAAVDRLIYGASGFGRVGGNAKKP